MHTKSLILYSLIFGAIVTTSGINSGAASADPSSAYGRQASMSPLNTTSLILGGGSHTQSPGVYAPSPNGNGVYLSAQPPGNAAPVQGGAPYPGYATPNYRDYPAAPSSPPNYPGYPTTAGSSYSQNPGQAPQGYPTYGYTSSYTSMMNGDLVQRNSQLQGGSFPYRNGSKIATSNLKPPGQEPPKANEEVMAILNKANAQALKTGPGQPKSWLDRVFHWDIDQNMAAENKFFNQTK